MWWKMSLAAVLGVVLGFGLDYAVLAQALKESPPAICVLGDNPGGAGCPYADDKAGTKTTIEVLSDTRGVDFGPYLFILLQNIRKSFYSMIPQLEVTKKPVSAVITLRVRPDGTVWFVDIPPSKNYEFDGMALSAIEVNKPFAPLPAAYKGSYLALKFTLEYNQ